MSRKPALQSLWVNLLVMTGAATLVGLLPSVFMPHAPKGHSNADRDSQAALNAEQALQRLVEGNRRYAAGMMVHPDQTPELRDVVAKKQKPFAVILSCSDSRVPPEVIFDQGLGDLFVIRIAGNLCDDQTVLGSIEYAVEELKTPLLIVLGHKRCGAVQAAVNVVTQGAKVPGHIGSLVSPLAPIVQQVEKRAGDLLDNAVRENIRAVAQRLRESRPLLAEVIAAHRLRVVGAYYDLDSGIVEMML